MRFNRRGSGFIDRSKVTQEIQQNNRNEGKPAGRQPHLQPENLATFSGSFRRVTGMAPTLPPFPPHILDTGPTCQELPKNVTVTSSVQVPEAPVSDGACGDQSHSLPPASYKAYLCGETTSLLQLPPPPPDP